MSCTICTKSFGFFNREHGCPVCKYSFCAGCLKYKLVLDGRKLNVCLRCSKLSSPGASPAKPSPSRVPLDGATLVDTPHPEQIVTEVLQPVKPEQNHPPPAANEDDLIRSKLEALRAKEPNEEGAQEGAADVNDNTDIEKRLAALKGVEYKDYKNAAQRFLAPDNRTEQEQVQDLIGRYVDESKLDSELERQRMEQDEEIMRRLNALKEFPAGGGTDGGPAHSKLPDSDSDDSVNDEAAARKLAQRYAEEGKLAAQLPPEDSDEEILSPTGGRALSAAAKGPTKDEEEELPWCTICNEDAVLRCHGCDNDLYCQSCFKEFHYDEDPREHGTVAFKPKTRKNK